MSVVQEIQRELAAVEALRAELAESQKNYAALYERWEADQKRIAELEDELGPYRKGDKTISLQDEHWLFEVGATVRFVRKMTPVRRLTVRDRRGRHLADLSMKDGTKQSVFKQAVAKARKKRARS